MILVYLYVHIINKIFDDWRAILILEFDEHAYECHASRDTWSVNAQKGKKNLYPEGRGVNFSVCPTVWGKKWKKKKGEKEGNGKKEGKRWFLANTGK